nr:glycosyltransferase family 2 protein [Bifidobacterium bombi]
MNIAAGIVTYNPDIEDIKASVPRLMRQVQCVVVVDNGSDNVAQIEAELAPYERVVLLKNAGNLGVAAALNRVFEWSRGHGYDWVLTLDDDSQIPEDMVEKYGSELRGRMDGRHPRVGIVCPLLKNRRDGTVFHSKRSRDECITSGSLTSVAGWEAVHGFDEWLFIDGVDFDFSRRLVAAGYELVECSDVVMPHQIGESRSIHVLGHHPIIWNHAAFRQYYIQRNNPYIDYKLGTYSYLGSLRRMLTDMLFVIVGERDRPAKIRAMLRGWKDGQRKIRAMRGAKVRG